MSFTKQRFVSAGLRLLACGFLVTLASLTASAYTLVMRDGRRLSVPDDFVVTKLTLTYAAGERIQVTLLLASIDIPATERANNERSGSLLGRAQIGSTSAPVESSTSQRLVTNRDLDRFRSARLESEAMYERRRREQGLPSLEEWQKQSVMQTEAAAKTSRELRARELELENFWRSRASELRAELVATSARIDFVRARLNELPANAPFGVLATDLPFTRLSTAGFGPVVSTIGIRQLSIGFRHNQVLTLPTFSSRLGSHVGGRVSFGGRGTNAHLSLGRRGFGGVRNAAGVFPLTSFVAIPYQDYSYERSELMVQLNELLGYRAGLQARWRDLEEEARRAGAYPGWLRP